MKTELLISEELPDTTREKDIFNLLDRYFKENDLEWGKLVGCTTNCVCCHHSSSYSVSGFSARDAGTSVEQGGQKKS